MKSPETACVFWMGVGDGAQFIQWLTKLENNPIDGPVVIIDFEYHEKGWLTQEPVSSILASKEVIVVSEKKEQMDLAFWNKVLPRIIPFISKVLFFIAEGADLFYRSLAERWQYRLRMLPKIFENFHTLYIHEFRNNLSNRFILKKGRGVRCLDRAFTGKPAILISAGPSLNDSLPYVKNISSKALFLCVGTVLKKLLEDNIIPHAVVVVDPLPLVYTSQFENLKIPSQTWLITSPTVDPRIIDMFDGRVCFFYHNELMALGLSPYFGEIGLLQGGGSVSHYLFSLAEYLGASPIFFMGQDFAYGTDGSHHYSDKVPHVSAHGHTIVEGWDGGPLESMTEWQWYLWWLESAVQRSNIPCIDVTCRGAKKQGMTWMRPREARDWLQKYLSPVPMDCFSKLFRENSNKVERGDPEAFYNDVSHLLEESHIICEQMLSLSEFLLNREFIYWEEPFSKLVSTWDGFSDWLRDKTVLYTALQPFYLEALIKIGSLGMINSFEKAKTLVTYFKISTIKLIYGINKLKEIAANE
ncbi:MAG: hypothetical protein A4E53_00599 [Pelotomaculum sp. PtaB.Bin104]|nr:MAG: hypothetical protein A4E53_00599 [Pelotomaculum sp. PtaB.Bin104]